MPLELAFGIFSDGSPKNLFQTVVSDCTSLKSMFEFLPRFEFLAGARAGRESREKNKGSGWKFLQPLISLLIKSYQKFI